MRQSNAHGSVCDSWLLSVSDRIASVFYVGNSSKRCVHCAFAIIECIQFVLIHCVFRQMCVCFGAGKTVNKPKRLTASLFGVYVTIGENKTPITSSIFFYVVRFKSIYFCFDI